MEIVLAGPYPGQVSGQASVALADGHLVVVEDHHHRLPAHRQIIQCLINHAAGGRAIAHQRHNIIVLLQKCPGPGHAQGNGNGAGGVTCHKGIGIAFCRLGEAGHAAVLPQTGKIRLASRQQLMDIRLMTHIKTQAVFPGIIYGFNGNGQLYHT